jgi:hypothetical protein
MMKIKISEYSPIRFFIGILIYLSVSIFILGGLPFLSDFSHEQIFSGMIYGGVLMGSTTFLFTYGDIEDGVLIKISTWILYCTGWFILGLSLVFGFFDFFKILTWFGYK